MGAKAPSSNAIRLKEWLVKAALPIWSEQGVDSKHGGFYECLDFDGEPVRSQPKRMRVQGRQLYTFSHAAMLGWNQGSLDVARRGFEFLTQHYWHKDGGWIFSVNEDGSPLDDVRESYEQAFALFGFAWYYRASNDERVLPWLEISLDFLDGIADKNNGGYRESIPDKLPRRQNPHMHLLEAFMALFETFNDRAYLERGRQIVELANAHYFAKDTMALGEFFNDDWSQDAGESGRILEPGHHFEWTWLLNKYASLSGQDSVRTIARALFKIAEQQGSESSTGLAYDEMTRDGKITKAGKRLWPQTEALKAHLVLSEVDPHSALPTRSDQLVDLLFEHYLKANGTWQDKLNQDNQGFDVSAPASSMYHLFVSFDEYLKRYASADYSLS